MDQYQKKTFRCNTVYQEGIVDSDVADYIYRELADTISWEQGIRSRKGETRLAKALDMGDNYLVDQIFTNALEKLAQYKYVLGGIYLNYYKDGNMWTPNHSHKGTHQLVISLGAVRSLEVGKKKFNMTNGSAIIFGSVTHGVPKCNISGGRISIAGFLIPIG